MAKFPYMGPVYASKLYMNIQEAFFQAYSDNE